MKTQALLTTVLTLSVFVSPLSIVIAQTKTPTVTPEKTASVSAVPTAQDNQIKQFKNKMAQVVELNQKKRAYAGVVLSVDGTKIKIKSDEIIYEADVENSLTKAYTIDGTMKTENKLSDIKKDAYIIVTGPMIDKKISPVNYVYFDDEFIIKEGKVSEVNKTDFYVKVLTTEKDTYTYDIESTTKTEMFNTKTNTIERVGFSKFREGDTIHVVYKKTPNQKEPLRVSAGRILIIPQEYFVK